LKVGVVAKLGDAKALSLTKDVVNYGTSLGIEMFIDERLSSIINWHNTFVVGRDYLDYLIIIGGDGTLLNTLHMLGDKLLPLITIRAGKKGFLYDVPPEECRNVLNRLLRGDYRVKEYMRLEALIDNNKLPYALNEYVITTSGLFRSKVADFKVFKALSGCSELILNISSDGLIIASPIGSTAYNLSVGGPIVDPDLEAIIITPLASLTLIARPLILPPNIEVHIEVAQGSSDADIIADGRYVARLPGGGMVKIRRAPQRVKFIRFFEDTYAKLLQRIFYGEH